MPGHEQPGNVSHFSPEGREDVILIRPYSFSADALVSLTWLSRLVFLLMSFLPVAEQNSCCMHDLAAASCMHTWLWHWHCRLQEDVSGIV